MRFDILTKYSPFCFYHFVLFYNRKQAFNNPSNESALHKERYMDDKYSNKRNKGATVQYILTAKREYIGDQQHIEEKKKKK